MSKKTQVISAFVFGCVFVCALLVLAIFIPNPTPFQYQTFRIVMALAAAGIAAMIPGFLKLEFNPTADVLMRSGGALAVFVIVYFFNPAKLPERLSPNLDISPATRETTAKWQPPELPQGVKNVSVGFGRFLAVYKVSELQNKRLPFTFGLVPDTKFGGLFVDTQNPTNSIIPIFVNISSNRLFVDVTVSHGSGEIEIHGNSFRDELPIGWDSNTNSHAIEIVDSVPLKVCQVVYERPERVVIQGVFTRNGFTVVFLNDHFSFGTNAFITPNDRKPLFKYPSGLHPGELAE